MGLGSMIIFPGTPGTEALFWISGANIGKVPDKLEWMVTLVSAWQEQLALCGNCYSELFPGNQLGVISMKD